ncbi:hypothetical protein [Bacillus sp. USDA818B3_A]|uniref:hypothetical protein n=1 Tax=Bacillus sp. USDA818B3_A TaxID=2698834 RepID=UPI00136AD529|nr:hypothetical protein [Bacillus sp. USDA818B3_A]
MKNKKNDSNYQTNKMDHPEQYETTEESLFDKFQSERTVDPIPMEDLNEEKHEEKRKRDSKHTSSSEKKYGGL